MPKTATHPSPEEVAALRTCVAALVAARQDMAEWLQLAERQRAEMPTNTPLCPTAYGVGKTRVLLEDIDRTLTEYRKTRES